MKKLSQTSSRLLIGGFAVLIVVLGLIFMQPIITKNKVETNSILKVGVILPLTGKLSRMGDMELKAMNLAVVNNNKISENKIKLFIEDNASTPKNSIAAANKLIFQDRVDIIITSTTGASLAVEPIATSNKMNLLAFCMDPSIASKSNYVIRPYVGVTEEATPITNYFNKNVENQRVGFLYVDIPAFSKVIDSTYLPKIAKNNNIVFNEKYKIGETDFRNLAVKMKTAKIDHLILLGYGFEYAKMFDALVEQQAISSTTVWGGWGFLYTDLSPAHLENIRVSGAAEAIQADGHTKFQDEFMQQYGMIPNFDGVFAYDAITFIGKYESPIWRKPIKTALQNVNISGLAGKYVFDKSGNMIVPTTLLVYKNGNLISFNN